MIIELLYFGAIVLSITGKKVTMLHLTKAAEFYNESNSNFLLTGELSSSNTHHQPAQTEGINPPYQNLMLCYINNFYSKIKCHTI